MLQEAVDERFGRECTQFGLTRVRCPVVKCNLVVLQLDQAAVADGNAEDIRGQVFQGRATIANRFAMHHPILLPDPGWYLREKGCLLQCMPELAAKDFGDDFHWQ